MSKDVAKPEEVDGSWRIRNTNGTLVGLYKTKSFAQQAIDHHNYLFDMAVRHGDDHGKGTLYLQ